MKFFKLILTLAITSFFSNILFLKVYAIDLDYQENFALDKIIVTLSNEQSSKLINYDTSYFKELNLKEIVDLTQTSKEVFKNRKGDDEYCDIIVKWKDGDNSRFYVYKGKNDSTFTSAISTTTNTSFYS